MAVGQVIFYGKVRRITEPQFGAQGKCHALNWGSVPGPVFFTELGFGGTSIL